MSAAADDLFGATPAWPEGLRYSPEFLSIEQEQQLLGAFSQIPMQEAQYYQYTAKRRVASFGPSYDFETRQLRDATPLPDFLISLRKRVADLLSISGDLFAQVLITDYRPGTALGWHRDALNYELVAGISLGGKGRMRFRPYPPRGERDSKTFALELAPRSIYVMRDDVRWRWQHSIPAAREQRWSITFRTLRQAEGVRAY